MANEYNGNRAIDNGPTGYATEGKEKNKTKVRFCFHISVDVESDDNTAIEQVENLFKNIIIKANGKETTLWDA